MAAKIKICGLMRREDATAAAAAGASYLGVVFAEGRRRVTAEQASDLVAAGRGVPVMGVFTDHRVEAILQIAETSGLRGAQLHGPYSAEESRRLRSAGLEVWRVVRIATPADLDLLTSAQEASDAVLVEPLVPHLSGGAGIPLELAIGREARHRLSGHPMVLAGGLTSDSVAEALTMVRPDIVDVSSGVEERPGVKDHHKIVRFVEAVFAHSPVT